MGNDKNDKMGLIRFGSVRSSRSDGAAECLSPSNPSMATMEAMRPSLSLAVAELGMRSLAANVNVCRTVRALWCTLSCDSGDGDSELRLARAGESQWWLEGGDGNGGSGGGGEDSEKSGLRAV